jgi:diguanylate cyclase (GGDEF)-like protein/PAS domain S-box-containing protein
LWEDQSKSREMAQHILLIQANALDAAAVIDALSKSSDVQIEWVATCALGLTRLAVIRKQGPRQVAGISAVLVDLQLPDTAGIDAFDRLFASIPHIPILILSSPEDEIDRAAIKEALLDEKERAQVTLNSIGDAVISTDIKGQITYLNIVAEQLTGWSRADSVGRQLEEVFRIIDRETRAIIPNPMALAARTNEIVGIPATSILIRRDGIESAIEDSCAPIHNRRGDVTGAVMVFRDVSTSRALSQRLVHLAQHDSLTDLPNRDLLNERLTQAIATAQRRHASLGVLYLDLDRFKHINDSLGHSVGDRLLQSVAQRLRGCVRSSDTVGRLGGDEFVILLLEVAHAQDAAICADKIIKAIGMLYTIDEIELHITVSIGIAVYPEDGIGLKTLLQNADSAMYEAKERGRNNYQFYRADLNAKATERQLLEHGLRHAIERNELELHYQPIVNLATGKISGLEALLRWLHPSMGAVPAVEFISVAEESGLIVPIGQWALRQACEQFNDWQRAGVPIPGLAVNISAVELRWRGFVAGVAATLAETGIDPRHLTLELTETFLMQDSQATSLVLKSLRSLGVQLALDDFGTGYSSLSYVRRFPIDVLKVDRSFVLNLSTNADDACVVSAVINMGKSLRMRVVAEGVETPEQVEFLKQHGCSEAQGHHFSRPLRADDVARFVGESRQARGVHQQVI